MKFLATTVMMFAFWLLLSGFLDPFHLITGLLSSMAVAHLSADLLLRGDAPMGTRVARMLRFLRYLPWLLWQIVKANLDVAYRVVHPRMPIDPQVIRFKMDSTDEMAIATLSNSITLTPGTVTIKALDGGEFVVHAITREAADAVLEGEMTRRVLQIERGGTRDV